MRRRRGVVARASWLTVRPPCLAPTGQTVPAVTLRLETPTSSGMFWSAYYRYDTSEQKMFFFYGGMSLLTAFGYCMIIAGAFLALIR